MMVQYQMEYNHHLDTILDDVNEVDFVLVDLMDHMNMNHNNYRNVAKRQNKIKIFIFRKFIFALITRGP